LLKLSLGNLGDIAPVGEGVLEMHEHFGPGWRMHCIVRGQTLVIMLGDGDKSTPSKDIRQAIQLAQQLED
jgi:putative addiction module killer protein